MSRTNKDRAKQIGDGINKRILDKGRMLNKKKIASKKLSPKKVYV